MPSDNRAGSRDWDPSFPEFAVENPRGLYDDPSSSGAPYETAPDGSHVYGWRLKSGSFGVKFLFPAMRTQGIPVPEGTTAIVEVAFKPKKEINQIDSEYMYFFESTGAAENYIDKLRGETNPGKVVNDLKRARIPYHRFH